jgi:hypothetical protein
MIGNLFTRRRSRFKLYTMIKRAGDDPTIQVLASQVGGGNARAVYSRGASFDLHRVKCIMTRRACMHARSR